MPLAKLPQFQGYERPANFSMGDPEVLVRESTLESIGMPRVDFDSLSKGIVDDLGIPADTLTYRLHHGDYLNPRPGFSKPRSFRVPATHTVFINTSEAPKWRDSERPALHHAVFGEQRQGVGIGVTEELLTQTALYAHKKHRNVLTANRYPITMGAAVAGLAIGATKLSERIDGFQPYSGVAVILGAGIILPRIQRKHQQQQAELRMETLTTLLPDHASDILFPKDPFNINDMTLEKLKGLGLVDPKEA